MQSRNVSILGKLLEVYCSSYLATGFICVSAVRGNGSTCEVSYGVVWDCTQAVGYVFLRIVGFGGYKVLFS